MPCVIRALSWLLACQAVSAVLVVAAPSHPIPSDSEWDVELIASAPALVHPSVVTCSPDGRIFVAEDPMDISAPKADLPQGRILCIHPDGRITRVADGLYAVFGMKYLEGRLFVLHNPKFSVFTISDNDAVGSERVDLIESTNPNPWALDWNDHVPANFVLAMDGYFYVAVGDKGLYHCHGVDGRQIDLHGGGVVRIRPDGSGLEIYSTGVRNILDVAITSEDDLFTYDNTDEQQWMSRVTQMIDGGFYGYPFDFVPRRPYTLWAMADYGGGAATGALAYTEDALPAKYRDSLFLADFGKRQVLQLELSRDGGSFRVERRSDMFRQVPDDFRPVGMCVDATGEGLLICDWQHADNKEPVAVGRLWHVRYRGPSVANPRPAWYLPAAMGKPCDASFDDLIAGLQHPARTVRMIAQRRICERALLSPERHDLSDRLKALISDQSIDPLARVHGMWALAAMDKAAAVAVALTIIERADDQIVMRQALRVVGELGSSEAATRTCAMLAHDDRSLRMAAAIALGRIGGERSCRPLIESLDDTDLFARYSAFVALARIGRRHPESWRVIVAALDDDRPMIRTGAALALREQYAPPLIEILTLFASSRASSAAARCAAIELLSGVARKTPQWQGQWWAYHPVNLPPPAKSETWEATVEILGTLRALLRDAEPTVRASAALELGNLRDGEAAKDLRQLALSENNAAARRAAVRSLGLLRDRSAGVAIQNILSDPSSDPDLIRTAISVAGNLGDPAIAAALIQFCNRTTEPSLRSAVCSELSGFAENEVVEFLAAMTRDPDAGVAFAAIESLGRVPSSTAGTTLVSIIDGDFPSRRQAAFRALFQRLRPELSERLIEWCADRELRDDAMAALTRSGDPRGLPVYLELLAGPNAALRADAEAAIRRHSGELLPAIEARATSLSPQAVAALQRLYAMNEQARQGLLFAVQPAVATRADYQAHALANSGDGTRGRAVFANEVGAGCIKCHANSHIREVKTPLGPDLTTIGAQFPRAALIEHVLYPNFAIREGYQQWIVTTTDGRTITGLARGETDEQYLLVDRDQVRHAIDKIDVEERISSAVSMMPEGLEQSMTMPEFADLIAFLESCRQAPESPAP